MSRITTENVAAAIRNVSCMSLPQNGEFAEVIHRHQPHLLASCVVQPKLDAHINDVEFLLNILPGTKLKCPHGDPLEKLAVGGRLWKMP